MRRECRTINMIKPRTGHPHTPPLDTGTGDIYEYIDRETGDRYIYTQKDIGEERQWGGGGRRAPPGALAGGIAVVYQQPSHLVVAYILFLETTD
jgi:hypothetical protein